MSYPRNFYYQVKQSEAIYSHVFTGDLDVNRFLQNKAYWRMITPNTVEKQKTLILADWTASQWSPEKEKSVVTLLQKLQKDGFQILIWQQSISSKTKSLEVLNMPTEITFQFIRENMTLAPRESIINLAVKKHNLIHDQVFVLDDYWLQACIDNDFTKEREIDIKYLYELKKNEIEHILSLLTKEDPPLNALLNCEFTLSNRLITDALKELPSLNIISRYDNITVNKEDLEKIVMDEHLRDIFTVLNTLGITKVKFDAITEWSNGLEPKNLDHLILLLQHLKTIRRIDLDRCSQSNLLEIADKIKLDQLETIVIKNTNFFLEDLCLLLNKLNNVRNVDLSACQFFHKTIAQDINLSLESFHFHSALTTKNLGHFLSHSRNTLRELNIKLDLEENHKNLNLTILESLTLYATEFSESLFKWLVGEANTLQELYLVASVISEDTKSLDLSALKKLVIKKYAKNLENLLLQAPNLEQLILYAPLLNNAIVKEINLKKLKRFESLSFNISAETLQKVLSNPENLIQLVLSGRLLNKLEKPLNLTSLRIANLYEVSGENLQYLFANAINLKELSLKNILDPFREDTNWHMNSLLSLNLQGSNITMQQLCKLIDISPNLKFLDITGCDQLSKEDINKLKLILNKKVELKNNLVHTVKKEKTYSNVRLFNQGLEKNSPFIQKSLDPIKSDQIFRIDANTRNTETEYHLDQIFCGAKSDPHPREYRLAVTHHLRLNPQSVAIGNAFIVDNKNLDLNLVDYQIPTRSIQDLSGKFKVNSSKQPDLFYGKLTLNLDTTWQALPSLTANDYILEYHLENANASCEIKYSQRDNLYYIRTQGEPCQTTIDFLMKSDFETEVNLENIPDDLIKLIADYQNFGEGKISLEGPATSQQYLDAINSEHKGACRHRAVAMMDAIQNHKKEIGLPDTLSCRYISNNSHAFVEIQLTPTSPWMRFDLGGYSAKLKINKQHLPKQLVHETKDHPSFTILEPLPTLAENDEEVEYFKKKLKIGDVKKPNQFPSISAYCFEVCSGKKKKQLIQLSSTNEVLALAVALEKHCHHINRPVYYIHSPEDLVCSAPSIKRMGNVGEIVRDEQGQSGPLHEFLTTYQNKANPPILIVNYDNFAPDDIVRLNALLDEKDPKADGTEIKNARVIGLINPKKPGCYQGEDFYSRFGVDNVEKCPLTKKELLEIIPNFEIKREQDKTFPINLYHAADWEGYLLGRWQLHGNNLVFQEGLLAEALNSGLPIEIQNGLWDDPSFCHFWHRALSLPKIEAYGQSFDLSKSMIIKSEGYDWSSLKEYIKIDDELKPQAIVLNPNKLCEFFYRYQVNDLNQLEIIPGWLKQYSNHVLDVNLTRFLSDDEWAKLLTECKAHHVTLNCHVASSVMLSNELNDLFAPTPLRQSPNSASIILSQASQTVIESTDVDVTVCKLTANENWKVIDVSELNGNDLLTNLSGKIVKNKQEKLAFEFFKTDYILKKALATKENIILKGKISSELADNLASILLDPPENLRIITSDARNLTFAGIQKHEVTLHEKFNALIEKNFDPEDIKKLENLDEPFCKLQTRLLFPDLPDPWYGLKGLSGNIQLADFNPDKSKEIADEFVKARLTGIQNILYKRPYVFITGLTGVGKSTFIEKYLGTKESPVFIGEEKINEWMGNESGGFLFIDEANITNKEWSQFYGLLNDPPGIFINGDYKPLSKNHYVIFAGNPFNYGGERCMSPLFEDNGVSFVFEPMPLEFIYEAILKPIFENTNLASHSLTISLEILKIYQFICRCSREEVLISPRELQMMALLVLSHANNYGVNNILDMTRHYGVLIARSLVPGNFLHEFDKQFPVPKINKPIEKLPKDFLVTASRKPLYQYLSDLISLRNYRLNYWAEMKGKCLKDAESAKLYGGLGGIVIEGEPGIGKSELVVAHLIAHGYEEVKPKTKVIPKNAFYRLPVNMDFNKKEAMLLKAFDEGAIVIIDEINSSPMMERLLNALLMGKKPNGDRPKNPGFMIIGTQNPVTMAGRCKPSNALKRRITTVKLTPYPPEELISILQKLGVKDQYAQKLEKAFEQTWNQAQRGSSFYLPTFRDLKRVAKHWMKIQNFRERSEQAKTYYADKNFYEAQFQYQANLKHYESILNKVNDVKLFSDYASLCLDYASFIEKTSMFKQTNRTKYLFAQAIYTLQQGIKTEPNDVNVKNLLHQTLTSKSKAYVFDAIRMLKPNQQVELFEESLKPGKILESFFSRKRNIFKAGTPDKIRDYLNLLYKSYNINTNIYKPKF